MTSNESKENHTNQEAQAMTMLCTCKKQEGSIARLCYRLHRVPLDGASGVLSIVVPVCLMSL